MKLFTVLCIFLVAAPIWSGTFRVDFSGKNVLDNWRLLKGRTADGSPIDTSSLWFVENGELVCLSKGICQLASTYVIGDKNWKDYIFECKFKIEEAFILAGCGYPSYVGIGVYFDDTDDIYVGADVGIYANTPGVWWSDYYEIFHRGGAFGDRAKGKVQLQEKKWYNAKIDIRKGNYKMFVDEQLIMDFQNQMLDSGAAGFLGRNCKVHFDNVSIAGDKIPNSAMSVKPQDNLAISWGAIKAKPR